MVECIEDYRLQLLKLAEVGTTADLSDIEETEGEAVVLLVLGQVGEELLDHPPPTTRRDIVLKNSSMADSALAPQERRQGQLDYLG